jgi:hypothetical protein
VPGAVELRDLFSGSTALQCGMPWTIANLVLHDKPVRLANMRSVGTMCSSIAAIRTAYHNTELDVSRFPDDVTFNDLQPRMLCTVCDHRGADVGPSWLHHG